MPVPLLVVMSRPLPPAAGVKLIVEPVLLVTMAPAPVVVLVSEMDWPRRSPEPAACPLDHQCHRIWPRLHARRRGGARGAGEGARPRLPHGRRALRQCGG